ncbi:MAG: transglycosylase family protein [Thermoleophilaceae bacterium]
MTAPVVDIADLQDQCQRSIERSRPRRTAAEEWRRSRFRRHGGTASVAATGVLVAVGGSGAVGVDLGGAQPDGSDGASESEASSQARISTEGRVAEVERTLEEVRLGARPGELTQAKLRRLQQKAGLVVDGIGGLETLAALRLPEPESVEPAAQAPQPVAEHQPAVRPRAAQSRASKRAPARRSNAGVEKAPARSSSRGQSNSTGGGNVPAALQRIAQCESGGNPGAIGGGGAYRGKYQFSPDTWRSLGGSGDPAKAPESEQDRRAAQLYARSGAGQWPSCGR